MRELFKFFLYFVFSVITIIACTGIIIAIFYSENIKQSVVQNIQSNLNSKTNLSDLEFTLWEHFPYASVKFNDFLAYEKEGFNNDTLLYAKEAFCDFNLLDIISKKYNINRIYIRKGVVNVKYDEENKPNYLIFNIDSNANKKISIEQVVLINSKIIYSKLVNNTTINWNVSEAVIEVNEKNITVNGELFSNQLFIGKMDYLNNKQCSLWGK